MLFINFSADHNSIDKNQKKDRVKSTSTDYRHIVHKPVDEFDESEVPPLC